MINKLRAIEDGYMDNDFGRKALMLPTGYSCRLKSKFRQNGNQSSA